MELDEMKNLWKEENKKLESRLRFQEETLRKMNLEKTVSEFDKLLKISLLGRNLALVYGIISFGGAFVVMEEFEISIPAFIAGLAMIWSFIHHLKIEKPDYFRIPIVELQKSICKFRIHTATSAKYDGWITTLWVLSVTPLYIRLVYKTSVYNNPVHLLIFCLGSIAFVGAMLFFGKKIYKGYDIKLRRSESYLDEIIEFEKG